MKCSLNTHTQNSVGTQAKSKYIGAGVNTADLIVYNTSLELFDLN